MHRRIALPKAAPVFRLARLRKQTLAAATQFHDFNFRLYFVGKTNDTFNEVSRRPDTDIEEFVSGAGREQLAQMRRMSTLDATYSRTPVFLDPVVAGTGAADDLLPHGGSANRKRRILDQEEEKDE